MKRYYLGIDTSCYTTSCAVIDEKFNILGEARKMLDVPPGAKGLRQSDMVFQHSRALPDLIETLPSVPLAGIGVSSFPRRKDESYMPVFLVGSGYGRAISHMTGTPLFEFAHQENHILAALRTLKHIPREPMLALHLSGGTTELVRMDRTENGMFDTHIIGGSDDLQGGQFVDRIGVALGLPFPAGKELETLALQTTTYTPLPSSVKNGRISFSGPCSAALRNIERGASPNETARAVFMCIGNSLEKLFDYHLQNESIRIVIAVGGVLSNSLLRKRLTDYGRRRHITVHFAEPRFSVDNATGNAFGAAYLHRHQYYNHKGYISK